jgi:hypothetical protein
VGRTDIIGGQGTEDTHESGRNDNMVHGDTQESGRNDNMVHRTHRSQAGMTTWYTGHTGVRQG